jgi:hypothetical protein
MTDRTAGHQLPPTPAEWTDMADGHVIWLHLAWTIAHGKDNRAAEIPEDARRELDERLGRVVFENYDAIIDAACAAWRKLIAQPETITSIGMRQWAHVGQPL